MSQKPIPDDINPPDRIGAIMPIGQEGKDLASSTQSFSSFMQAAPSAEPAGTKAQMISPFDLAQGGVKSGMAAPNLGTIMSQVNLAQSTMTDLQTQMNYPNLKLKPSQKYIIKNKLTDANANLRAANNKMGATAPDAPSASSASGPLGRFLGYVTDGMNQLNSAKLQLATMKEKGHNLSPGDFLMIQIKMNKAQQELDFTSVLLSKAVEDFKTMMNVQL